MIERFSHDRAIISLISTSSDNFAYPEVVGIVVVFLVGDVPHSKRKTHELEFSGSSW